MLLLINVRCCFGAVNSKPPPSRPSEELSVFYSKLTSSVKFEVVFLLDDVADDCG
jgi:hypothetical protein